MNILPEDVLEKFFLGFNLLENLISYSHFVIGHQQWTWIFYFVTCSFNLKIWLIIPFLKLVINSEPEYSTVNMFL